MAELSKNLAKVNKLQHLELFFSSFLTKNCREISSSSLNSLSQNITSLAHLEKLSVKFGWSDAIEDDGLVDLGKNLSIIQSLKNLEIGFYFCKSISNVGLSKLSKSLAKLKEISKYKINVWSCESVTDIGIIDTCLNAVKLPKLEQFEVNSDNYGWKVYERKQDIIDFATSLMMKNTHKQFLKHQFKLYFILIAIGLLSLIFFIVQDKSMLD